MEPVYLYSQDEFLKVKRLRKRYIWAMAISFALIVVANVLIVLFRHSMGRTLAQALNMAITAVYLCALWFFFSIKFRLTHNYYKTLKNIFNGLVEENTGKFLHFEDTVTNKD